MITNTFYLNYTLDENTNKLCYEPSSAKGKDVLEEFETVYPVHKIKDIFMYICRDFKIEAERNLLYESDAVIFENTIIYKLFCVFRSCYSVESMISNCNESIEYINSGGNLNREDDLRLFTSFNGATLTLIDADSCCIEGAEHVSCYLGDFSMYEKFGTEDTIIIFQNAFIKLLSFKKYNALELAYIENEWKLIVEEFFDSNSMRNFYSWERLMKLKKFHFSSISA